VNDRARARIAAAAHALAGKAHTQEELHDALFTLVRTCYLPEGQDAVPVCRMPAAGEVLPPQQRAMWARAMTVYDVPDASILMKAGAA
jgi:hypothetical protein